MEDLLKLSMEEIKNLSEDQKREYAHKLIHSEGSTMAAFFNPNSGEVVTVQDLAEQMGEEEAIDFIVKALNSEEINSKTLTGDEIKELFEKSKRGECTEEEQDLVRYIQKDFGESNAMRTQYLLMKETLLLIDYIQNGPGYRPALADIALHTKMFYAVNLLNSSNSEIAKFNGMDIDQFSLIAKQVGEDIYDTWKASLTSEVSNEMAIMGLLHLLVKLSNEAGLEVIDAKNMADYFGLSLEDSDDEDCDECSCGNETDNGSNTSSNVVKPATYSSSQEDKEMRDLLRD